MSTLLVYNVNITDSSLVNVPTVEQLDQTVQNGYTLVLTEMTSMKNS